jgi:hypothetical protein
MVFEITPAEEVSLVSIGLKPESEYAYCRACWRVLQDSSTGPSLMRGAFERGLLRLGLPAKRAKVIADRYQARLVEMQRRAKHSTQS